MNESWEDAVAEGLLGIGLGGLVVQIVASLISKAKVDKF
jgi:hypothetical protein